MRTLKVAIEEIKSLKVQGANQIALYGLAFLRRVADETKFGREFKTAAGLLENARPTAVVLHNCIKIIMSKPEVATIDSLIDMLHAVKEKEAAYSRKIIPRNSRIMTYCHSGEAMAFIKHAWTSDSNRISVIACKTEPMEQGIVTARELSKEGIPVTLIDDNAIGFFMKDVDMAIVGADSLRKEGVVNKIGTSLLAQSARASSKPFYIIANSLKIDRRSRFEIEERPPSEINSDKRRLHGITIRNPAFDITPWRYVTRIINEGGIFTTGRFVRLL